MELAIFCLQTYIYDFAIFYEANFSQAEEYSAEHE